MPSLNNKEDFPKEAGHEKIQAEAPGQPQNNEVSVDQQNTEKISKPGSGKLKKISVVLFLVIILGSIGVASLWAYNKYLAPRSITQLIPGEAQAYLEINTDGESQQIKQLKSLLSRFPYFDEYLEEVKDLFNEQMIEEKDRKTLEALKQIKSIAVSAVFPTTSQDEIVKVLMFAQVSDPKNFLKLVKEIDENQINEQEGESFEKRILDYRGKEIYCINPVINNQNISGNSQMSPEIMVPQGQAMPIPQVLPNNQFPQQPVCLTYLSDFNVIELGNGEEGIKESIDLAMRQKNIFSPLIKKGNALFYKEEYDQAINTWKDNYLIRGYQGDLTEVLNLFGQTIAYHFSPLAQLTDEDSAFLSLLDQGLEQYLTLQEEVLDGVDQFKDSMPSLNQPDSLLANLFSLANTGEEQSEDKNTTTNISFMISAEENGIQSEKIQSNALDENEKFFKKNNSLSNYLNEKVDNKWMDFYFERASLKGDYDRIKKQIINDLNNEEQKKYYEDQLKESLERGSGFLGVDIEEEILNYLDKNYALFVAPSFIGQEPAIGAVFNIEQSEKLKGTINKISRTFFQEKEYCYEVETDYFNEKMSYTRCLPRNIRKNDNIYSINNLFFAIDGDKLLIASSEEAIKNIRNDEGVRPLLENQDFQNQFSQLPEAKLKSISYIYTMGFWGLVNPYLALFSLYAQPDEMIEIEKIARGYLKVLKSVGSYNYMDDKTSIGKTFLRIEKLPPEEEQEIESLIKQKMENSNDFNR